MRNSKSIEKPVHSGVRPYLAEVKEGAVEPVERLSPEEGQNPSQRQKRPKGNAIAPPLSPDGQEDNADDRAEQKGYE